MKLIPIIGNTDSNCYLLKGHETALIDTGAGLERRVEKKVRDEVNKVDLIINTHAHYDHCGGNIFFPEAKICIHRDDANEMLNGKFYGTYQFFGEERPIKFHRLLQGGDKIDLGDRVIEVIHTPGHTYGSICLYDRDNKILFTGDTLFKDSVGRVDLGGDIRMMENSINKIASYEVEMLFPGHGEGLTGRKQIKRAIIEVLELFF